MAKEIYIYACGETLCWKFPSVMCSRTKGQNPFLVRMVSIPQREKLNGTQLNRTKDNPKTRPVTLQADHFWQVGWTGRVRHKVHCAKVPDHKKPRTFVVLWDCIIECEKPSIHEIITLRKAFISPLTFAGIHCKNVKLQIQKLCCLFQKVGKAQMQEHFLVRLSKTDARWTLFCLWVNQQFTSSFFS